MEYVVNIANMHAHQYKPDPVYGFFRVDRLSPVGNPFPMKSEKDRDWACTKYVVHFNSEEFVHNRAAQDYLHTMLIYLQTYKSITLLCWCVPKRCHAETIKEWLLEYSADGVYPPPMNDKPIEQLKEIAGELIYHGRHFNPSRDKVVVDKAIRDILRIMS
jgi:hypothetical protein